ncbi:MAG: SDR family oxidoreductase [Sphingobacteriaceae bacterium]|nr:MAG: SDR family oxidoreductase [Sphingobacteriaceae bacterium]
MFFLNHKFDRNGRTESRVEQAIKSIKEKNPNANVKGLVSDLSNAEGSNKVITELPDLDILVNNMGIFEPKVFEEIPDEDWFKFFETNFMSDMAFLVRQAYNTMLLLIAGFVSYLPNPSLSGVSFGQAR